MNDALLDPFRHNAWANREQLGFCGALEGEQLGETTVGAYGSIHGTLDHILDAEEWYLSLLEGVPPTWSEPDDPPPPITELLTRADEVAARFERLLSAPYDPDRLVEFDEDDGGRYGIRAGVLITQVLNHGTEHRDQVNAILTSLGVKAPELDGWAYGAAAGRAGAV